MLRRGDNDGLMLDHSVGVLAPEPRPARVVSMRGSPTPLEELENPRFRDVGDSIGEDGSLEGLFTVRVALLLSDSDLSPSP